LTEFPVFGGGRRHIPDASKNDMVEKRRKGKNYDNGQPGALGRTTSGKRGAFEHKWIQT